MEACLQRCSWPLAPPRRKDIETEDRPDREGDRSGENVKTSCLLYCDEVEPGRARDPSREGTTDFDLDDIFLV